MRRILLALAIALTVIALPGVGFATSDEDTVRLLKRDADRGDTPLRKLASVISTKPVVAASPRASAKQYASTGSRPIKATPRHETISASTTETAAAASPETSARLCVC